jgi:hypothetical protein
MSVDVSTVVISILASVILSMLTFYLKDYLQRRSDYQKLKKKLEQVAGKGAMVVYSIGSGIGMGAQLYKIEGFDREGVTLRNEAQTIFVPASKIVQSEWIIPGTDYEKAKAAMLKKEAEGMMDAIFPTMIQKMMPAIKEWLEDEIVNQSGEINAVIGIRIQKALQDEGLEIKQIKGKDKQG